MLSRRHFLQRSSLVALSPLVPAFLSDMAGAAPARRDSRILVVIQLEGGNDGINTVVPFGDDGYFRNRKELRLKAGELLKLNDHVGLHPAMKGMARLLEQGRLAVVQGVGYPNPNRSHFESMRIWQTARMDGKQSDRGWLGRTFDQLPGPRLGGPDAIYVGSEDLPRALWGRRTNAATLTSMDDLKLQLPDVAQPPPAVSSNVAQPPSAVFDRRSKRTVPGKKTFVFDESQPGAAVPHGGTTSAFGRSQPGAAMPHCESQPGAAPSQEDGPMGIQSFVARAVLEAYGTAHELAQSGALSSGSAGPAYPGTKLAVQLRLVSQLIKSGAATRVYYAAQSSYDTHFAQLPEHERLLSELSGALRAFMDDLNASGLADRVLVMAFSEFGRRVAENGSLGTDHGTAAPLFLAGNAIRPGLIGPTPSLEDLDHGDLKMSIDFRRIYAAILRNWLGLPAMGVLAGKFQPADVLRPIT